MTGRLLSFAGALIAIASLLSVAAPNARATVRYRDEIFPDVEITKDLVYGAAVNHAGVMETLKLDVHEPAGDAAPLRAAVVWVHGGYFVEGDKEGYAAAIRQFARAGFVVFSINYRLQDIDTFPYGVLPVITDLKIQEYIDAVRSAQHDAQAAIRWVRKHAEGYRINPEQVAIAGHSAGGITAQSVNYNDQDPGVSGNPGYSSRPDATVSSAGTGAPFLTSQIDTFEPPLLMIHGVVDDVVPFMPLNCVAAILLLNTCELVIDPDRDHEIFGYEFARDFLYRQMIDKPDIRLPAFVTVTDFP
jgi:acetyl esterase/lipase